MIKSIITIFLISFSSINTYGQDIETHKWVNRILIVKTLNTQSKKYERQLKEFRDSVEEFIDRKLVLYKIIGNDFVLINYNNKQNKSGTVSRKLSDRIFNKNESFEIILIGLDGQIKLQQTEILTNEYLFRTIDAMPMRKNEMKH